MNCYSAMSVTISEYRSKFIIEKKVVKVNLMPARQGPFEMRVELLPGQKWVDWYGLFTWAGAS